MDDEPRPSTSNAVSNLNKTPPPRQQKRQNDMTPEQKQQDAARKRQKRSEMTSEQKQQEAERKRQQRSNLSPAQKQNDAERKRQKRSEMTPEERQNEAARRRQQRSLMPPERRRQQLDANNSQQRDRYQQMAAIGRNRTAPPLSKNIARNPATSPEKQYLGSMNSECGMCGALHFSSEATSRKVYPTCCGGRKVNLRQMCEYPGELHSLLTVDNNAKHFRENIRKYNSAFAFASFGHQSKSTILPRGPQAFIIHGQVYHLTVASTQLAEGERPTYAQLYMLDPEFANNQRMEHEQNKTCRRDIMERLQRFFQEYNVFAHAYRMMKDVVRVTPADNVQSIRMWIVQDREKDKRRYNLPMASEIAAVFKSDDGEPPFKRDICIYPTGAGQLQNIEIISPNCDPMVYPVLFPYGEAGWQPNMKRDHEAPDSKQNELTMRQYYSYRLQERTTFSPLLHSGKLTQQFIVDAFLKVEGHRLKYIKEHQTELRVDSYMGLMDYVNSRATQENLKAGKVHILPSSFYGSKRALTQNYQDAMAVVAKFGKPDLFITFTCNPKWKEIQDELRPHESTIDRPDIVATVFCMKLKEFIDDMTKNKVMGGVIAYMYVIEFQKRGLPHCHMLFILDGEDKFREPEHVDNAVCAEIPDATFEPELANTIETCMMHGPCGEQNKKAPCMEEINGVYRCTKNFPKTFSDATNLNVDGYPLYRRRDTKKTVEKGGVVLDNRWVVPYNPYFCKKYNAHINVEICSSVKSVKYIFKYIYKGHDAAVIRVNSESKPDTLNWDEIAEYINTRYIAAPEAMWRLRGYEMHGRSPAIIRLALHLEHQQQVYYKPAKEQSAEEAAVSRALEKAEAKGTTLTEWFKLNASDPTARQYLYTEIPYHYVFDKKTWTWIPRKRGVDKVLPRMYSASPKELERYYLRLLLLHVRGATCYNDLKVINGEQCNTFREACVRLNLLDDDQQWHNTMTEAVEYQLPKQLRLLFTTILVLCEPAEPPKLYQTFKVSLMEDFLRTREPHVAENMALQEIEQHLLQFAKSCGDFGLPLPQDMEDGLYNPDPEQEREVADHLISMFNPEQLIAFRSIMEAVEGRARQTCFFLSGPGGCGKTFVYKALTSKVLSLGYCVKAVAPTGLAATLLKNGQTVHSGFKLPLDITETSISRITQTSKEYQQLKRTKLIIWDEISMCHAQMLAAVDRSLQDLMNSNAPFGGITIVVGGDFRQQAPVVIRGCRAKIVEACVKSSKVWKHFETLRLTRNMRVSLEETGFANWLLKVGDGFDGDTRSDYTKIPNDMITTDILKSVLGEDLSELSAEHLASRAILCPKNEDTLFINSKVLNKLTGESKTFYSVDSVENCETEEERSQFPIEFLNSITPMGMPRHALELKEGCCVMLLRNLNPKHGLCNGTRLIVDKIGANLIHCTIFSGDRKGDQVFIPRICLSVAGNDVPFELKRKQFPLRLAYSMTITKAQGQTFDNIGVFLPQTVFTHGQLYTAFSRVRSREGLKVQMIANSKQGEIFKDTPGSYTFNCVYNEIL